MGPSAASSPFLFRTIVAVQPLRGGIDHCHRILSVGSCFSENIAARLESFHFPVCTNPSGVLYNPLSIASLLHRLLENRRYASEDLFRHDDLYRSFDHHGSYAAQTDAECLERMNASFEQAREKLEHLDIFILTLGTSFVYRLADTGHVVANCHKLPHDRFTRELAPVGLIVEQLSALFYEMRKRRPDLRVIATVSPVRHLRDNPHENQISKSHLLAALHELEQRHDFLYYFPAYEILMDELRDYRFYDTDMVHPSPQAADYIWLRFVESCVSDRSRDFIRHYAPVIAARKHRIMNASRQSKNRFAAQQMAAILALEKAFPDIPLQNDKEYFRGI